MKKSFLVLGAIMFALLFAGCKGAEDSSEETLKDALLELADDDGDKFIEKLFDNPKISDTIKISVKDENSITIKDFYYTAGNPHVATFALTDDGIKVSFDFGTKDSFILGTIDYHSEEFDNTGRTAVKVDVLDILRFYNKDKSIFIELVWFNGYLDAVGTSLLF